MVEKAKIRIFNYGRVDFSSELRHNDLGIERWWY
jgi:hypothetical protein